MKYFKYLIFLALIIQLIWVVFWTLGYKGMPEMSETNRQTYSIMANVKYLILIALYIAWRVTPDFKSK
jgi:hypothetical protein